MDGHIGASQMLRLSTSSLQTRMDGVTLDMRKPYRIYVMNGGTLNLTGGSITNADILVKSGGTLNVSGNSQIILRSTGGNLNVDKGAVMNIPLGIIR